VFAYTHISIDRQTQECDIAATETGATRPNCGQNYLPCSAIPSFS